MANLTQQMIDFAMSLPPSTNPYETTAAIIRKETQAAKPALWAVILRRIIDFHYLVLCGQAIIALWLRKKSNKLDFFRYNKLGLIHVEVLNDIVLLMLIFSLLAFIDGIAQELAEQHLIRFSSKMVIHTSKFCFSAAACWCKFCNPLRVPILKEASYDNNPDRVWLPHRMDRIITVFVWILSIEAAMNLTSLGARARAGASIRLSPCTRFIINSLLLAVMAVPSVMIVGISILRATILAAIEATSEQVIATLLKNAPTYRAERDNYSNLVQIVKATESISPNSKRLAHNTRLMLIVYFAQHVMISAVYLPTMIIICQRLHQKSVAAKYLAQNSTEVSSTHPNKSFSQVRTRIIKHAFLIFLEEILYIPPLVYMLFFFTGPRFYSDPTFLLIDHLALHGPSVITGNILMAFSIQNTLYILRKQKHLDIAQTEISLNSDFEKTNQDASIKSLSH
ncbi:hypothetical protein PCANC_06343 [Puccinia coronata f. sp. avenae]|uniref:Uncharacterized protein n=1 Tax=Puccinia coronata f. sp. avenae TaxID=200324 RepID=A0A2N5T1Q1_9BASI|nr:hypothetical protein PCANC_06343 [Puccinia coronata f. sp. avenae]